jgi:hypothetical protein
MIFDQPPAELPVATLRPRDSGSQLLLDLRGWLAARWQWLGPRAIPVAVAFAGMLAVLASASYLRELAHQPPEQLPAPVLSSSHAASHGADQVGRLRVITQPAGAVTIVTRPIQTVTVIGGAQPVTMKIEPGIYRIKLEPVAPAPH